MSRTLFGLTIITTLIALASATSNQHSKMLEEKDCGNSHVALDTIKIFAKKNNVALPANISVDTCRHSGKIGKYNNFKLVFLMDDVSCAVEFKTPAGNNKDKLPIDTQHTLRNTLLDCVKEYKLKSEEKMQEIFGADHMAIDCSKKAEVYNLIIAKAFEYGVQFPVGMTMISCDLKNEDGLLDYSVTLKKDDKVCDVELRTNPDFSAGFASEEDKESFLTDAHYCLAHESNDECDEEDPFFYHFVEYYTTKNPIHSNDIQLVKCLQADSSTHKRRVLSVAFNSVVCDIEMRSMKDDEDVFVSDEDAQFLNKQIQACDQKVAQVKKDNKNNKKKANADKKKAAQVNETQPESKTLDLEKLKSVLDNIQDTDSFVNFDDSYYDSLTPPPLVRRNAFKEENKISSKNIDATDLQSDVDEHYFDFDDSEMPSLPTLRRVNATHERMPNLRKATDPSSSSESYDESDDFVGGLQSTLDQQRSSKLRKTFVVGGIQDIGSAEALILFSDLVKADLLVGKIVYHENVVSVKTQVTTGLHLIAVYNIDNVICEIQAQRFPYKTRPQVYHKLITKETSNEYFIPELAFSKYEHPNCVEMFGTKLSASVLAAQ